MLEWSDTDKANGDLLHRRFIFAYGEIVAAHFGGGAVGWEGVVFGVCTDWLFRWEM
jgi:hypothetical protein